MLLPTRPSRRRLADVRRLVPRILAGEAPALRPAAGTDAILRAELTSTDMVVVLVGAADGTPAAVIRVATTPQAERGLELERRALEALHADPRLGGCLSVAPRVLASGELDGRHYRVDSALPGRPMLAGLGDDPRRERLLEAAAAQVATLHNASAADALVDGPLVRRWVDEPAEVLLTSGAARGMEAPLARVRAELHDHLADRHLAVGWIHGDYWLGNVLFDEGDRLRGIVDWDAAADAELAMVDLLHLVVYTRRLCARRELGDVVGELILGKPAAARAERDLLARHAPPGDRVPAWRQALLLYWLRHAAHHTRQQPEPAGWRYRLWIRRNVRPVLRAV